MAKKRCELCGINLSSDMLFGVALCDGCREVYSDTSKFLEFVETPGSLDCASPNARRIFMDKVQKVRQAKKESEKQEERRRQQQEQEQERRRKEQERNDAFLKENGHEGYYEYKVISLYDENSGCLDVQELSALLNTLGRAGWHLKCAYSNELGHNSTSGGIAGFSMGTNATIDQNVLILERFIKFK